MTPAELRDLSQRLEDATGYDSIATIEDKYARVTEPAGAIECAFSHRATMGRHDCRFRRKDPAAMWLHVHFGRHGQSFGYATPAGVARNYDAAVAHATKQMRDAARVR